MDATLRAVEERGASAWARWTSARERRQLIENTLLPQADATWQSALASYQVGEVDFGTLLEALNEWQGADLARVDALRDELLGAAAVRDIEGEIRCQVYTHCRSPSAWHSPPPPSARGPDVPPTPHPPG